MEIPMAQKSARSSIYKIQERILDRSNRSTVGK